MNKIWTLIASTSLNFPCPGRGSTDVRKCYSRKQYDLVFQDGKMWLYCGPQSVVLRSYVDRVTVNRANELYEGG